MTCSIEIIRRKKPVREVLYVPDEKAGAIYYGDEADEKLRRARRAIIQHIAEQELLKEMEE